MDRGTHMADVVVCPVVQVNKRKILKNPTRTSWYSLPAAGGGLSTCHRPLHRSLLLVVSISCKLQAQHLSATARAAHHSLACTTWSSTAATWPVFSPSGCAHVAHTRAHCHQLLPAPGRLLCAGNTATLQLQFGTSVTKKAHVARSKMWQWRSSMALTAHACCTDAASATLYAVLCCSVWRLPRRLVLLAVLPLAQRRAQERREQQLVVVCRRRVAQQQVRGPVGRRTRADREERICGASDHRF